MAPKQRASSPVPDDWEDDDSDESAEGIEERNRRIWEEANTKAPAPMPTIVTSSASPSVNPLPPPAAFHPTLRILKRPSSTPSSPGSSSETSTPDASAMLKEREAQYQAARERIFGADTPAAQTPSSPTPRIIREPRGPSVNQDQGSSSGGKAKGFAQRRESKAATSMPTSPGSQ